MLCFKLVELSSVYLDLFFKFYHGNIIKWKLRMHLNQIFVKKSRKLPFFRIATVYIDLIKLLNSVINS